jgi:hypothetical protein
MNHIRHCNVWIMDDIILYKIMSLVEPKATSSQPSIEEIEWLKYKVVSHDNIKTSLYKLLPCDQMILPNDSL